MRWRYERLKASQSPPQLKEGRGSVAASGSVWGSSGWTVMRRRRLRVPFELLNLEVTASLGAPHNDSSAVHQKVGMGSDHPRRQVALSALHNTTSLWPFSPSQGVWCFKRFLPFPALVLRSNMAMYHEKKVHKVHKEKECWHWLYFGPFSNSLCSSKQGSRNLVLDKSVSLCHSTTVQQLCTGPMTWNFLHSLDHSQGNLQQGVWLKKMSHPAKVDSACV